MSREMIVRLILLLIIGLVAYFFYLYPAEIGAVYDQFVVPVFQEFKTRIGK